MVMLNSTLVDMCEFATERTRLCWDCERGRGTACRTLLNFYSSNGIAIASVDIHGSHAHNFVKL